jgi:hypothetical protein
VGSVRQQNEGGDHSESKKSKKGKFRTNVTEAIPNFRPMRCANKYLAGFSESMFMGAISNFFALECWWLRFIN